MSEELRVELIGLGKLAVNCFIYEGRVSCEQKKFSRAAR